MTFFRAERLDVDAAKPLHLGEALPRRAAQPIVQGGPVVRMIRIDDLADAIHRLR